MKVLWLEVTEPSAYASGGNTIGGWQDSLERIVRTMSDIELTIAFISTKYTETREISGVTYVPIHEEGVVRHKIIGNYWEAYVNTLLVSAKKIIADFKPNIIHVFGTEWPLGQVAQITEVPVVIHLQGIIIPYNNALYPPGYDFWGIVRMSLLRPRQLLKYISLRRKHKEWEKWERKTWNLVPNYMGRTNWDYAVSEILHPGRNYYHVDEALRPNFLSNENLWQGISNVEVKLVTTGISTFWKGPDMMLKTARILKESNFRFTWNVVGHFPREFKNVVEKHEGTTFEENNVKFLGYVQPDELSRLLCQSTLMVHTAYVENSPNSICEAQCIGLPVISTNVGGISTLVHDGVDGILVSANDPWYMASCIVSLVNDKQKLLQMSEAARRSALERHNPQKILTQLQDCYRSIIATNQVK